MIGMGGIQGLVDVRGLGGGVVVVEEVGIGMWVMCYYRCVGYICFWGYRDFQCIVDRLGVSDLRGCSVFGDCFELGICEGDIGIM